MPDPVAVNSIFSRIARRYDLANFCLSGGVDRWWRRRLVAEVVKAGPSAVLDLATGSGDVAFALARRLPESCSILALDFCQPMLAQAVEKQSRMGAAEARVKFGLGDGLQLPCPDASFDAVTIAFGLRNMSDRHRALQEMRRVLRSGGRAFILEFSQPWLWFAPVYFFYTRRILPVLAGWLTGDSEAYRYLNASIEAYPNYEEKTRELIRAGFSEVKVVRMTAGIVALHVGRV